MIGIPLEKKFTTTTSGTVSWAPSPPVPQNPLAATWPFDKEEEECGGRGVGGSSLNDIQTLAGGGRTKGKEGEGTWIPWKHFLS